MRSVKCTSTLLKMHFEKNEGNIIPTNVELTYLWFFFFLLHLCVNYFLPYYDTACLFVTGSEYSSRLVL